MTDDEELHPANHPTWQPAGSAGHYCIAERWCPCGHMNRQHNHATKRLDGKRGNVSLDYIEESGGNGSR